MYISISEDVATPPLVLGLFRVIVIFLFTQTEETLDGT